MSDPARGTEAVHPLAARLDGVSTLAYLEAMLHEDRAVLQAVRAALPDIAELADLTAASLLCDGRLILAGAGTSGRLAALEAAECPPTFGTDPAQIVALLAGGPAAMLRAVEGAEDDANAGASALDNLAPTSSDLVLGISASGSTPFVRGVLDAARRVGTHTAILVCNDACALLAHADSAIILRTGPEFVAGSTRLKAGSAQKLALNMLTTATMRVLGRVRTGRMVALRATNAKLQQRAISIVRDLAGVSDSDAAALLARAGGDVARALALADPRPESPLATSLADVPIELRPLTPADAPAVAALAAEPSVVATTAPFATLGGAELFRAWLNRPGLMLGAWAAGTLLGVALVERRNALLREHVADITYVAVATASRGHGVGDRLLTAILVWAHQQQVTRLELRVWPANIAALRLYERHGFVVEGRLRAHAVVHGRYVDALLMARVEVAAERHDGLVP